jgi:hypothetical protein
MLLVPAASQVTSDPPPRMDQELALQHYLHRAERQLAEMGAYSDTTVIEAYLPSKSQYGRFALKRSFVAAHSLTYEPLCFVGNGFVKSNIIVRVLHSEVAYVEKGEGASTAISETNYKFSYKAVDNIDGLQAYVYEVKPRKKRAGLFKGKIFVDPHTSSLLRAQGIVAKSTSCWVKRIGFAQDYTDVGGFSMATRLHSEASTRLVGRVIVDIVHTDYRARSMAELQSLDRLAFLSWRRWLFTVPDSL